MQKTDIKCLVPDLPDVAEVLPYLHEMQANRWYTNFGPLNQRFEAEMIDFFAAQGSSGLSVGTFSSATTALELVLRAMQLPRRGRVLIPALTFPATALAVINAGLEPVLGDVDPDSWELTANDAQAAHSDKPFVAVMPVAAFGKPVPVQAWQDFQRISGVPVILDAAAALGQQAVPTDLITVFSLHATKPFGVGEGGLIATSDTQLLARARSLSNFGFAGTGGVVQQAGTNAKFGEYYAAVGLAQLKRWPEVMDRRSAVNAAYRQRLAPFEGRIRLQAGSEDFTPAVFPVYVKDKAKAITQAMAAAGILTRHWYLPLLHNHPALSHLEAVKTGTDVKTGADTALKACMQLEDSLIGLPFHGFLSDADIDRICQVLEQQL